jgi:hypothetical protein
MLFGIVELFFGVTQGRAFYRFFSFNWEPFEWAYRERQPVLFWALMLVALLLAIGGGSILAITIFEPSCWKYPGAIWLCPLDHSWN